MWPVTLPSVHAPDRDVDGSPATHNHPLGRRFPPGPGASPFSRLMHRRCLTASGPSTRSVSRTIRRSPTDHVVGLWESLWVRSICLSRGGSRGLTNRPRGPSACGTHLTDPGNRAIRASRRAVLRPGRPSSASGFAACALEDPAAAQRRHRPDEDDSSLKTHLSGGHVAACGEAVGRLGSTVASTSGFVDPPASRPDCVSGRLGAHVITATYSSA
jgi:hypothetical protein